MAQRSHLRESGLKAKGSSALYQITISFSFCRQKLFITIFYVNGNCYVPELYVVISRIVTTAFL